MVASIEAWRIKEFENNVYHLSAQKDARLWSNARNVSMSSKRKFFDRIGTTAAQARVTRHADTPNVLMDHSRRAVDLYDYNWGKLVDDVDILRTINDPTNPYAIEMANAFKRKKDDVLIAAMSAASLTDEDGSTSVALPNTQKIAAVAAGALSNMNVETLRLLNYTFQAADIDPELPKYLALSPSQIRSLLATTELTSSDYNSVKALVMGQINSFMGFTFIMTNRLAVESDAAVKFSVTTGLFNSGGTASTGRKCLAWVPDGMIVATGIDFKTRVSERDDKNYSTQVYGEMSIGATRMEDVKVVEVHCKEA